jgi:hypothetical protein
MVVEEAATKPNQSMKAGDSNGQATGGLFSRKATLLKLHIVGTSLRIIGMLMMAYSMPIGIQTRIVYAIPIAMVGGMLYPIGQRIKLRARRIVATSQAIFVDRPDGQSMSGLIAQADALPDRLTNMVLYLRPFDVDRAMSLSETTVLGTPLRHQTAEEILLKALALIGPCVTLGRPGELAFPGALRYYYHDKDWRDGVENLIRSCALCVINAGNTNSLQWELSRCVAMLPPRRLLIFFPDFGRSGDLEQQHQQQFRLYLQRLLNRNVPPPPLDTLFLRFDANWTPDFLSYEGPRWRRRRMPRTWKAYRSLLQPVLAALHIKSF